MKDQDFVRLLNLKLISYSTKIKDLEEENARLKKQLAHNIEALSKENYIEFRTKFEAFIAENQHLFEQKKVENKPKSHLFSFQFIPFDFILDPLNQDP